VNSYWWTAVREKGPGPKYEGRGKKEGKEYSRNSRLKGAMIGRGADQDGEGGRECGSKKKVITQKRKGMKTKKAEKDLC